MVHDFSTLFQCEKFNEYQGSSNSKLWINADLNLAGGNGETKANWNIYNYVENQHVLFLLKLVSVMTATANRRFLSASCFTEM